MNTNVLPDRPHIRPGARPSESTGERRIDGVISTMVAPRTVADDHSTRLPFPEVTALPPGSAASTPLQRPSAACATDQTLEATASLSVDGCYRWSLTRRWGPGPTAAWIMLNPSRADAATDDPTLRRVIGFAQAAGFGQITVTNLYAWRSPSPSVLHRVADPVGVGNDQAILAGTAGADLIVAAWGTHADPGRAAAVLQLLSHRAIWCLGRTRGGRPRHPLYVPARAPLQVYRRPRHDWKDWQPILDHGVDELLRERFCPTCGLDEIGVDDHRMGDRS